MSRQVTVGSQRGETSSIVTSLLLAPGERVGMGAGRREALWLGEAFKGGGWEGPNSGASAHMATLWPSESSVPFWGALRSRGAAF